MNVLIVEVDDKAAQLLDRVLTTHGYGTIRVGTGSEALEQLADATFVLLDIGLPDLAGHEVCRRIREYSCVPIIVLSDPVAELERVMALHMGADDFVLKPFGRHELMARVQAVLRRCGGCPHMAAGQGADRFHGPAAEADHALAARSAARPAAAEPLRAGHLRLDWRARQVFLRDKEVRITRKEFDLLTVLMEAPGTVVERPAIMCRVWDENWFGSTRTLDVHVGSLRSKLGSPEWIQTVRGVGYRLTVPLSDTA